MGVIKPYLEGQWVVLLVQECVEPFSMRRRGERERERDRERVRERARQREPSMPCLFWRIGCDLSKLLWVLHGPGGNGTLWNSNGAGCHVSCWLERVAGPSLVMELHAMAGDSSWRGGWNDSERRSNPVQDS